MTFILTTLSLIAGIAIGIALSVVAAFYLQRRQEKRDWAIVAQKAHGCVAPHTFVEVPAKVFFFSSSDIGAQQ